MSQPLDSILTFIGFGPYQWKNYMLISVIMLFHPFQILLIPFISQKFPEINPNCTPLNKNSSNQLAASEIRLIVTQNISDWRRENITNLTYCPNLNHAYRDSIVTEWNLKNEREYLIPMASSIFMIGSIVGSFLFATLSDRYGRKKGFIISMLTFVVATIAPGLWSPYYFVFAIFRFIQGLCHSGNFMIHMVLLTELLPRNKRYLLTITSTVFYSLGHVVLSGLAYAIPKWRYLQIVTGAIMCSYVVAIFFIDESIYWLVGKKAFDEASRLIDKAAKQNKKCLGEISHEVAILRMVNNGEPSYHQINLQPLTTIIHIKSAKCKVKWSEKYKILTLFTNPVLRKRTILAAICTFLMFQLHMTLTFGIQVLRGNMYLNFALLGITEIPGNALGLLALRFGRRMPIIIFNILCALTLLMGLIVHYKGDDIKTYKEILGIALFLSSRCFASGTLVVFFLYVSELFPTSIRNTGYGFNNAVNRAGFMLAPFIAYLLGLPFGRIFSIVALVRKFKNENLKGLCLKPHYHPTAMPLLLTSFCVLSSCVVVFLPPTKNKPLPQTMKDIY